MPTDTILDLSTGTKTASISNLIVQNHLLFDGTRFNQLYNQVFNYCAGFKLEGHVDGTSKKPTIEKRIEEEYHALNLHVEEDIEVRELLAELNGNAHDISEINIGAPATAPTANSTTVERNNKVKKVYEKFNVKLEIWEADEKVVLSVVQKYCDKSCVKVINGIMSPYSAMEKLKSQFASKRPQNKMLQCMALISFPWNSNKTVLQNVSEFNQITNDVNASGVVIDDLFKQCFLLNSLPEEWNARKVIWQEEKDLTYDELCVRLHNLEKSTKFIKPSGYRGKGSLWSLYLCQEEAPVQT